RSLASYAVRAADAYGIEPGDRALQFASLSFDASAEEIYPTLVRGAALVLRGAELASAPEFLDQCRAAAVTVLNLPTAYWHTLMAEAGEGGAWPECVRLVIIGGEEALPAALDAWQRWVGDGARLVNTYGPTEATIVATRWQPEAQGVAQEPLARVPIGRPIAGTRAYVLDRRLRPVAIGVAGELALDGPGLARTYLGRPQRTAEGFVPHPFRGQPGRRTANRLYRTGDLVRRLPDGVLEFLGRIDDQVKIRGFRIEPGEVEVVLARHPAVAEAVVVVVRVDLPGPAAREKRLVGYVVAEEGSEIDRAQLRAFLKQRLPEYMVPPALVELDRFPLTTGGKVDRATLGRRALPAPEWERSPAEAGVFRNPEEEILAGIWATVLGGERPGPDDNFFELGGHSLLATQVVSRVREVFGVELPLRNLFETPTVAGLAAFVEAAARQTRERKVPPIRPLLRQEAVPLSFAQQRLWFLDQLQPASPAYNIPSAVRVSGPLDRAVLARSLNEIVRRHEALRTSFMSVGGQPVQVIAPELDLALPVIDLRGLAPELRESEAGRLATADARRPFDLSRGPLLRATVVRLAPREHVVLLNMHHVVSDGWSMGVLIRELGALHVAFAEGDPSPLEELPIQYADHAVWQRQWLSGEVLEEELGYWRLELAGVPRLELPTDRPRPAVQTFRGGSRPVVLSAELSESLARLSREHGATLFMTLLAGFKALLARYAGQDDVAVGTPIAGRSQREIEDLIGFFVNTLVLRTDLGGDPAYRELLLRVRRVALDAYAHQHLPFERLVEELEPERDLSSTPLFQVMFVLQNLPQETLEMPELTMRSMATEMATTKFELTLSLQESGNRVYGGLAYNTDLFDQTTILRFVAHFERLLAGIAADPERRVGEVALWNAAERHQLLTAWNDTLRVDGPRAPFHELFEARVEAGPEAVAVVGSGVAWSYRELNRRANRLAARLRELGVGSEQVVGICLERSAELIAGLLAILKSGGAYLPLDPEEPPERLAYLLEDSGVAVVLAEERTAAALLAAAPAGVEVLAEWDFAAPGEAPNPASGVTASQRAYVIYTSGSTGRPKGVMVEHGSLVDYLRWTDRELLGDRAGTAPLVTPVTFDASLKQLFTPLVRGAAVRVPAKETVAEPAALLAALAASGAEALNCVPALWEALVEAMESDEAAVPESLRRLWVGGEELRDELVRRTLALVPALDLRNLYGPSEATANASWSKVDGTGRPTIGRPLANRWLAVLDGALRPVPIGVAGELAIAGPGVARGYLRRPGLTAARFVPEPFTRTAGGRLYRTGDRVRYLADGRIDFLGRLDRQVKLRGFRIELGEIEAVLSRHDSVRECVVVAGDEGLGGGRTEPARLVAYVAPADAAPEPRELRTFLRRSLPEHMVPSAWVVLEALPLLPSGKVDRGALPEPEVSGADAFAAPSDPSEELLAEIWAAVLGRDRVGVHDDFFELGGHSLVATQVVSRIRETFGVELALRRLFEAPTVAELAAAVRDLRGQGMAAPAMVRIPRDQQGLPREAVPLSFAQQRLWFLDQFEPGSPLYNIPHAVRFGGAVSAALLAWIFNEVVRRHEVLRTTFAMAGGRPRQVIAAELELRLPEVDLRRLPEADREAEAGRLARSETRRSFDLTRGPLLR
ncbi:MAG: amino acid adenylation domain-containing protein, partial [bacterium]|nr:amino acid adenylation domain-containing protein [bacterium]